MATREETCARCRHWLRFYGEKTGECRRYPPTAGPVGSERFTRTGESQWCGEFTRNTSGEVQVKEKAPNTRGASRQRVVDGGNGLLVKVPA